MGGEGKGDLGVGEGMEGGERWSAQFHLFQEDNDICSCLGGGWKEDNLCKRQGCVCVCSSAHHDTLHDTGST